MAEKELKLTRKEEEIIKSYEENVLEFGKIHHRDPRDEIIARIVRKNYGSSEGAGLRMTPEPLWDFLFENNYCPSCNSRIEQVNGQARGILEKADDSYVCSSCKFEVPSKLFEDGKVRNDTENKWLEKDEQLAQELNRKMSGKGRIIELAELGQRRGETRFKRLLRDEKD